MADSLLIAVVAAVIIFGLGYLTGWWICSERERERRHAGYVAQRAAWLADPTLRSWLETNGLEWNKRLSRSDDQTVRVDRGLKRSYQ